MRKHSCVWYYATAELMRLHLRMSVYSSFAASSFIASSTASNNNNIVDIVEHTFDQGFNMAVEPILRTVHNKLHSSTPIALTNSRNSSGSSRSRLQPTTNTSSPKRINLKLQSEYYMDIKTGSKTWEGRLYQQHYHGHLKPGDEILFHCNNGSSNSSTPPLLVEIEEIRRFQKYPCFEHLLKVFNINLCGNRKTVEVWIDIFCFYFYLFVFFFFFSGYWVKKTVTENSNT